MADVWFAKPSDVPPSLVDLLAAPAADLLGSAQPGSAAPEATASQTSAPATVEVTGPFGTAGSRTAAEDELLRQQLPLI